MLAIIVLIETMTEKHATYRTTYEDDLARQINWAGLPEPVREFRFHPTRRWRFDLAWPGHMLAIEIDGGIWSRGRHTRGAGYRRDCIKLNEALILGWRVLRVTPDMVMDGTALEYIMHALRAT
jgi:very-short-patch-repair endonuclease